MEKSKPIHDEKAELKAEKARLFRLFSETGSIMDYLEYSRLRDSVPEKEG